MAEWGPRAASFTIQGAVEDPLFIKAYAESVLARSAEPTRKVNTLTMPVRNSLEFDAAVTLDLYSRVRVVVTGKHDKELYITNIKHEIGPESWNVEYGFSGVASVAAPTVVPSPPFNGTGWVKRTETGSGTVSASGLAVGNAVSVNVTFPAFSTPPKVVAIVGGTGGYVSGTSATVLKTVDTITTTSARLVFVNLGTVTTNFTNMPYQWIAVGQ